MRFLHTGDWHVGRTLRGRSRMEEFAGALEEVAGIAVDEGVDVVLVSGDLYDQSTISAEADALIFETLIRLGENGTRVVAIPGNHDSAARLDALAPLLERVGTHVVAYVRRPEDGNVAGVPARSGDERALVACVPFVSPRRFSDAAGVFEDMVTGYVNFDANMGKLLAAYEAAFAADAVNVVLGHLFVHGAQPGGTEREVTIGSDYAVSPAHLPATAHYVALGHIHKPQKVKGVAGEARYSGSLLQLDFGERGQAKSVVVVEASARTPARVKQVKLRSGRALQDVHTTLDELPRLADTVGDAYLRVYLTLERPVPGIADRVRDELPNALDVRLVLPARDGDTEQPSVRGLGPAEQFAAYYRSVHSEDPPQEIAAAFDRVLEDVSG